jgi:hypothetical protein
MNHETVLHLFAKQVIQEAGGLRLPPIATSPSSFGLSNSVENFWLNLDRIEIEQPIDDVIPDIIGYFNDMRVIIEVAYSSFVDADKQAKLDRLGILALEIDLSEFHPEGFDPDITKDAILQNHTLKKWLVQPTNKPNCQSETITIKGIFVRLSKLPYGDLAIKVVAYNPEVNDMVKSVAKRYHGYWRKDYKNWLVPCRWSDYAKRDMLLLAESC